MVAKIIENDGDGAGFVVDLAVCRKEGEVKRKTEGRIKGADLGCVQQGEVEDTTAEFDGKGQEGWWRVRHR